eukprot:105432-Hanusia_phi.AAC.5
MQAGGAGESMSKEYTLRRQKTADILEQYKRVAEDAKRNMGTALAFLDSQAEEPLEQANVREVGMGAMDLSSYQMLKENFEQQLLNVRESYEEALNAVREQLNEMCEQYERLQASERTRERWRHDCWFSFKVPCRSVRSQSEGPRAAGMCELVTLWQRQAGGSAADGVRASAQVRELHEPGPRRGCAPDRSEPARHLPGDDPLRRAA